MLFSLCIVYLWCMHQVHLQQTGLQWSFCWAVVFQSIQKEGRALLDQVVLHKHINDLGEKRSLSVNVSSLN